VQIRRPKQFRTRYRITVIWKRNLTTKQDWLWPPHVPNSLPNGITRDSWANYPRDHSDLTARDITAQGFTWRSNERLTRSHIVPSHWPRWLPNGVRKDQEAIAKPYTELTAKWWYPWSTKWIPRTQRIIYPRSLLKWSQSSRVRTHWTYHPNDMYWETVYRYPTECQIKWWHDLHKQCTKGLTESRRALLSWWLWPPTVKLTC